MTVLNIRDFGEERKAALAEEARARGISVAELVRQYVDEGIRKARAERERLAWIEEAREGLAFEADYIAKNGMLLAEYRKVPGRS